MKTGTFYFPSYGAALRYYRPYATFDGDSTRRKNDATRHLVDRKLNDRLIRIGKPDLKPGQTLTIEDNCYHIMEASQ